MTLFSSCPEINRGLFARVAEQGEKSLNSQQKRRTACAAARRCLIYTVGLTRLTKGAGFLGSAWVKGARPVSVTTSWVSPSMTIAVTGQP